MSAKTAGGTVRQYCIGDLGSLERFIGVLIEHYAGRFRFGSLRCRSSSLRSLRRRRITTTEPSLPPSISDGFAEPQ